MALFKGLDSLASNFEVTDRFYHVWAGFPASGFMVLAIAALSVAIIPFFRSRNWAMRFSFISSLTAMFAAILAVYPIFAMHGYAMKVLDPRALGATAIILTAIVSMIILATGNQDNEGTRPEAFPLIAIASAGLILSMLFDNLFTILLSIELSSISLYALIGYAPNKNTLPKRAEAMSKYFILSSITSAVALYGLSLVFLDTDSLYLVQLQSVKALGTFGIFMFICALLFKASVFPFHFWAMDIFEGGSNAINNFLSVATKTAAIVVLWVVLSAFHTGATKSGVIDAIRVCAIISVAIGSIAPIKQADIRRILAYSGIMNMGILATVATTQSINAIYFVVYATISAGIFCALQAIHLSTKGFRYQISELRGIYYTQPITAVALSILILSLCGLPPFAGFFIKIGVFFNIANAGFTPDLALIVILSAASAFYYIKIVRQFFIKTEQTPQPHNTKTISPKNAMSLISMAFALINIALPLIEITI